MQLNHRMVMIHSANLVTSLLLMTSASPSAQGAVYLSSSWDTVATNVPLEGSQNQSIKAAIDVDVLSFLRLGINYARDTQQSVSYRGAIAPPATQTSSTAGNAPANTAVINTVGQTRNVTCEVRTACTKLENKTKVEERGFTVTFIPVRGTVEPYLFSGANTKTYLYESAQDDVSIDTKTGRTPWYPKVGAGLMVRINTVFSLKLEAEASPARTQKPGEGQKQLWDRRSHVGFSVEI